jgi:hypothetical protein
VIALVVVGWFAAGCGGEGPNDQAAPEAAFGAFRGALLSGDRDATWAFLGDTTRAALEARADGFERAGLARPEPVSLLSTIWIPDDADVAKVERVEYSEAEAVLRFETVLGHEGVVRMVRSEAGWRIDLNGLSEEAGS